ncbi:T9SS type A sorting domain-containing protein [Tamlana sp. s12]|uniref:T9SS type A sorting domain-containing protein n=1 Tax=Tamlana sp. s12 TaxID=1630406 RepID=UPI0007FFBA0E|nr:T9SS type A sorting domain-containing protein [Tamlana sp. s12]OBQ54983.1 hypothetical protein VQ01_09575 [Tamlana sp. s12]QQY83091.1 T9SS type A sorting domain-containing protein [Tamlana sp. s12]
MKNNYMLSTIVLTLLLSFPLFAQVDVIFRVDLGSGTISPNGIHIVGSLNGWDPSITTLTQEGSSTIYSTVIPLTKGWYTYKFLNGNTWGTEESPTAPCATDNGNRMVYVNDSGTDLVLETVPFGGCNADGTGFDLTFNVDASSEATIAASGLHIVGDINGWTTDDLMLSNTSGDIYSKSVRLASPANYPVTIEYKYLNGDAWGTEETPASGCATVSGSNRVITLTNSGENTYDVFNGCNYTLNINQQNFETINAAYIPGLGLKINTPKSSTRDEIKVSIYTISGRQITSKNIAFNTQHIIPLNGISKGLYLAYFTDATNQNMIKKFIVH